MRRSFAVLLSTLALSTPSIALADTNGVAFDQLQRVYLLGAEPPPIGSFDDLRSTFNALGPSVEYPALPGTIAGVSRMRDGVLLHYSFLGTLERVDDPIAQKATIGRPDKGEVDYLDLKAKTYTRLTGDAAAALLAPNLMQQVTSAMGAPSTTAPKRGTLAMTIDATTAPIASVSFDGTAADGYKGNSKVSTTATGQCPAVAATVAVTAYIDATRPEPFIKPTSAFNVNDITKAMTAIGCPTTFVGAVPTPDPALSHFIVYERGDVTLTLPSIPTPIQTATVLQRGHVVPLAATDAALFEIPAGFTGADAPQPLVAPTK
jgi:hypothetical protein